MSSVRHSTALTRRAVQLASLLIRPIAWPGWGIEYLIHLKHPGWQFSTYTSIPYFLSLFVLATSGVIYLPLPFAWIAFYPLAAAFLLATWLSIAIALGRRGSAYHLLREMARRDYSVPEAPMLNNPRSVFGAGCAFAYSAYSFGLLFLMIFRTYPTSFNGIIDGGRLWVAWQFQYFSAATITTIGYGDIHPTSFLSQAGVVLEAAAGIFYVVFLFAAIVSHHVGRLNNP